MSPQEMQTPALMEEYRATLLILGAMRVTPPEDLSDDSVQVLRDLSDKADLLEAEINSRIGWG